MSRVLKNLPHTITQGFKPSTHQGVDLTGLNAKDIRVVDWVTAHSDGVVVEIRKNVTSGGVGKEWGNSYGNYVKIKHDKGYETLYAHLAYGKVAVQIGEAVKAGQIIGYMGSTGHSSGAHLHFEVRKDKAKIDPTPYLDTPFPYDVKPEKETEPMAEKRYHSLTELPTYYQKEIEFLIKLGVLKGNTLGDLNLSEDMVRVLVVMARLAQQ